MSRQIIAIDLDDVIASTAQNVLDHYEKNYGIVVPLADFYSKDYTGVWGAPDRETAVSRINEYLESEEYINSPPTQETITVLRQLNKEHELHIITGRPDLLEEVTKRWLEHHLPDIFRTITFTNFFMSVDSSPGSTMTKADVCSKLGATVFIDDNLVHATGVAVAGIDTLLFGTYPWNEVDELPANMIRVQNWREVKEIIDGRS